MLENAEFFNNLSNAPDPLAEEQPQSMTPTPSCLTVGAVVPLYF